MEEILFNLLEATVTLYPANADGTPQLASPIWLGADVENLRGAERWLKKETFPSGAKHPRKHPLVAQYEVSMGRVWVTGETAPGALADYSADYPKFVLDILFVEETSDQTTGPQWYRKTFYGVTINEHSWEARDVEQGFIENQAFDAEYMIASSGLITSQPGPLPATLPYQVFYTGVGGGAGVLLYTYDPDTGLFAFAGTPGTEGTLATIAPSGAPAPFSVQFAGDSGPVVSASTLASQLYRALPVYRNVNTYRQNALVVNGTNGTEGTNEGICAQAPDPSDLPRLDFYYGNVRTATICRDGLYSVNFTEGEPVGAVGAFSLFGGGGSLVGVLAAGNLTATQIQVS